MSSHLAQWSRKIEELEAEVERLRGQRDAAREALDAAERELGSAAMSVKDAADRWEDGYLVTTADALALASERARAALASTVPSEEQPRDKYEFGCLCIWSRDGIETYHPECPVAAHREQPGGGG